MAFKRKEIFAIRLSLRDVIKIYDSDANILGIVVCLNQSQSGRII